ncbi:hypothetical protein MB46_10725 [Arthrobacter alpinus]|uniref:hypothetical protein n=1 Tax=Arthrobacter alpinus TaxID=656366 RepID=UPI0005C97662|nr:hypothetical protein [Arthrobacter alpinus]ALV45884.1 hypothetical protein MB46_10725 [Arthrobacter alpinus]
MSEMPRYNPAATEFSPVQAPVAPPIMNTVFYMLIGAAVLQVIATIFAVLQMQSDEFRTQLMDQLQTQNLPSVDANMVDTAIMVSTGTAIVMGVVAVILYVLIGLFLKKGMGWARIVGAVLAVVSLSQLMGMTMPGGIATILQILLGLGAMVLCFMGAGAAYFTAKKNYKLAAKGR